MPRERESESSFTPPPPGPISRNSAASVCLPARWGAPGCGLHFFHDQESLHRRRKIDIQISFVWLSDRCVFDAAGCSEREKKDELALGHGAAVDCPGRRIRVTEYLREELNALGEHRRE